MISETRCGSVHIASCRAMPYCWTEVSGAPGIFKLPRQTPVLCNKEGWTSMHHVDKCALLLGIQRPLQQLRTASETHVLSFGHAARLELLAETELSNFFPQRYTLRLYDNLLSLPTTSAVCGSACQPPPSSLLGLLPVQNSRVCWPLGM